MKWFSNLKIGTRIIAGFLLVAILAGAIGLVGINGIGTVARLDERMFEEMTAPLGQMVDFVDSIQRIHSFVKDIALAETPAEIDTAKASIAELWHDFDAALAAYEKTVFTDEDRKLLSSLKDQRIRYEDFVQEFVGLIARDNRPAALVLLRGQANTLRTIMEQEYHRMADLKVESSHLAADSNQAVAADTRRAMIVILAGGMVLAILIGILVSLSISRPLKKALFMIGELSRGHLGNRLGLKSRDEAGLMAQAMDGFADDLQTRVIGTMNRIAAGDLSMEITAIDEHDEIAPAMIKTAGAIRNLVSDANGLVDSAIAGKLDRRADTARHQGEFARIVDGVNRTLDAVIKPVQEASAVLAAMAQGNLQLRVTGAYQGDHAAIKNALNDTLESLSAYVREISGVLGEMAGANMDVAISGDYRGDFAPIKNALNLIVETFNNLLNDMNSAAEQVAAGARQVSDGSQALSQGATEQASSIEQLNATVAEIAVQTKQNALNAREASELAARGRENAVSGNARMQDMLKAMSEIDASSASISRIIKVIDDIAFQTNILALNAAVEAARAGQHGKGFAVVAEEVRNLAARSASAAKETTGLIEGSIQKVSVGTRLANDTATALNLIVSDVAGAAGLVSAIAIASSEQATGIAQVNQGVEQVSQVVQANSATAEQSAAASEELSGQSELLKNMISRFRLRKMSNVRSAGNLTDTDDSIEQWRRRAQAGGVSIERAIAFDPRRKARISLNDAEFGKF